MELPKKKFGVISIMLPIRQREWVRLELAVTAIVVWARSDSVSRVASLLNFFARGHGQDKKKNWVSACHMRGIFFARNFSVFLFAKSTDNRQQRTWGEHSATTLPPSSISRQHHVGAGGVSSLCCDDINYVFINSAICLPSDNVQRDDDHRL